MNSPEDSRLRKHFANLRDADQSAAPPFAHTAAAAAALPGGSRGLRIALTAVPIVAIATLLVLRTHRSTEAVPYGLAGWSSPTEFLLETPGIQILNQTPRLGEQIYALPAVQDEPK
jgi:hypothetical protein